MGTRRNIFLWVLYDFANSLVSIVFFLYFAQWIVVDRGMPDIYFNLTFTISAVSLLFTVPVTGFLLDKYFRRITGLWYTTIGTSLMIFITDTLGDIRDADLANVPTVAVTWGAHNRSFFNREPHKNLVKIVDDVEELQRYLLG